MKKKILISGIVSISIFIIAVLALTNMFTKGVITGRLYRVDNVYEEIWNMVNSEKHRTQTILTTSTEGAEVAYEFGCFEGVRIPVNDEYRIVLRFYKTQSHPEELVIFLFENNDNNQDAVYVYNYQTNTLYGDQEESHLINKFTSLYYSWIGDDGNFNSANHGDYTFVFEEYPLSHK